MSATLPRCPVTGKWCYATPQAAAEAVTENVERFGQRFWQYKCRERECGRWHVTAGGRRHRKNPRIT